MKYTSSKLDSYAVKSFSIGPKAIKTCGFHSCLPEGFSQLKLVESAVYQHQPPDGTPKIVLSNGSIREQKGNQKFNSMLEHATWIQSPSILWTLITHLQKQQATQTYVLLDDQTRMNPGLGRSMARFAESLMPTNEKALNQILEAGANSNDFAGGKTTLFQKENFEFVEVDLEDLTQSFFVNEIASGWYDAISQELSPLAELSVPPCWGLSCVTLMQNPSPDSHNNSAPNQVALAAAELSLTQEFGTLETIEIIAQNFVHWMASWCDAKEEKVLLLHIATPFIAIFELVAYSIQKQLPDSCLLRISRRHFGLGLTPSMIFTDMLNSSEPEVLVDLTGLPYVHFLATYR